MPCYLLALPTELVEEIISYLAEREYDDQLTTQAKNDLRSCALTCKTLFGPAIQAIWNTTDLLAVLKLLLNLEQNEAGVYVLTSELDEAAWNRFDVYSTSVKKLHENFTYMFGSLPKIQIDPSVWRRIALARPGPLLPGLIEVSRPSSSTLSTSYQTMFLVSPVLRTVILDLHYFSPSDLLAYLSSLRDVPSLESLTLYHHAEDSSEFDLSPVSLLKNLRHFQLTLPAHSSGQWTNHCITLDLGSLCYLERLEFLCFSTPNGAIDFRVPAVPSFHCQESNKTMQELDLYGLSDVRAVSRILSSFNNSPMESFSISLAGFHGLGQFRTTLSTISPQWAKTLTRLVLDAGLSRPDDQSPYSFSNLFGALYTIGCLEELHLHRLSRDIVYVSDSVISDLCNAWPRLTHLHIALNTERFFSGSSDTLPTVASLYTLGRCPALSGLEIPFYPLDIPPVDHASDDSRAQVPVPASQKLHSLFLHIPRNNFNECNLFPDALSLLASHLALAFPHVKSVKFRTFQSVNGPGLLRLKAWLDWAPVNSLLQRCHNARR
ncbi:hypothetical protein D9758_005139 [Tetrapyrgos nigripes]|uniref:F-box domain-containing protein n=1 Tax=Tetrapyrgos nigripes TaxID=182062 RepID=A0A8H5GWD5_9AGAR|nr:hypothetical protein D9758_005139 [Tetrapyrgos nigripes]